MNEKEGKEEGASIQRRMIKSDELFSGASELVIQHQQAFYRLIITKAGKLILNK